jgi:hypothetical protein
LPKLGTVPVATTSEGPESEAKEEHRCNKQISSTAKLPATNTSELKGETVTDLFVVQYTSPALSIGFPLAVEEKKKARVASSQPRTSSLMIHHSNGR